MQNRQTQLLAALIGAVIIVGGALYLSRSALAPSVTDMATTTSPGSTSTPASTTASATPVTSNSAQPQYAAVSLPISSQDAAVTWTFKGAYSGNTELTQKTQVDIARLSGSIDEQDPTVQERYVAIGKDYMLLGDGQNAYKYFLKALNSSQRYEQEDALAWANLGQLMEILGATHTALTAYTNATKADPHEPTFYVSLINFLIAKMPGDTETILATFAAANKNVPGDMSIVTLRGQYDQMHH